MNKYRVAIFYTKENRESVVIYCNDVSREGDYLLLTHDKDKVCEMICLRPVYRFKIQEVTE